MCFVLKVYPERLDSFGYMYIIIRSKNKKYVGGGDYEIINNSMMSNFSKEIKKNKKKQKTEKKVFICFKDLRLNF